MEHHVNQILLRLEAAGFEAWLVGGCVRDRLMGITPHDYDITTSARPEEVMAVFHDHRVLETGLKHGTVTLLWEHEPLEITTYRAEGTYSDHRHPDNVTFTSSLQEDLARRDFTMNAIAMDARGSIADPFHGAEDIAAGIIRCVGDPVQRFTEDALRTLRALRFASRLGFAIEDATKYAMELCAENLSYVSPERIFAEITKLLCGSHVRPVLMAHIKTLGAVLPELLPMEGFDQRNYHHIYDVWEHTARVVEKVPPEPHLRFAALFHDAGKPHCFTIDEAGVGHFYGHAEISREIAGAVLAHLRCDNATRSAVDQLIRYHDTPIECTERSVRRALRRFAPEGFRDLIALKRADNLAQSPAYQERQRECDRLEAMAEEILLQAQCFSLRDLAVKGNDLLNLGLQPGPQIGTILEGLLEEVMSDRLPNDREALLNEAQKQITQSP